MDTKYVEAVERNVKYNFNGKGDATRFVGRSIEVNRTKLGIKKGDDQFDHHIKAIIKKGRAE